MKKFWDFKAKDKVGELYLYGEISSSTWWGDELTPKQFKDDLDALGDIDTLHVYINSGGGDVFAGWAIINILQRHKAYKIGYNDGLAASMAFCIYQSLDKRVAAKNSMFMSHNCWTYTIGNRHELRKQADEMEKIDNLLAEMVSKKSNKTIDEIMAIQDAETWYTAQEAVDAGFADEMEAEKKIAACVTPEILAKYKNPPDGLKAEEQTADDGGFLVPENVTDIEITVKQGKEPVSDIQKRRFDQTSRTFKITEVEK